MSRTILKTMLSYVSRLTKAKLPLVAFRQWKRARGFYKKKRIPTFVTRGFIRWTKRGEIFPPIIRIMALKHANALIDNKHDGIDRNSLTADLHSSWSISLSFSRESFVSAKLYEIKIPSYRFRVIAYERKLSFRTRKKKVNRENCREKLGCLETSR